MGIVSRTFFLSLDEEEKAEEEVEEEEAEEGEEEEEAEEGEDPSTPPIVIAIGAMSPCAFVRRIVGPLAR